MKEYKINLTQQFREELDKILYFFPYSNISKRKLYWEVKNIVQSLSIFPERYQKINYSKRTNEKDLRKIPINKFVIIYNIDEQKEEVYILHIFYEKQNYFNQL